MAQQSLNLGTNANDGTGDTLRVAMDKVNDNFTELYNSPLFSGHLTFAGNEISATRSNDDIVFVPSGTGSVTCLLYTSPSPRDRSVSRMPSSA